MVKLPRKSLTIKFTPEEWEIIARVAGREPIAIRARDVLLDLAPAPTPFEVVTAEILALRIAAVRGKAGHGGVPPTPDGERATQCCNPASAVFKVPHYIAFSQELSC